MSKFPEARWLETHEIPNQDQVALTDPEGLIEGVLAVSPIVCYIMERLDGSCSVDELLKDLHKEGIPLPRQALDDILRQLEENLCLEGPRVEEARREAKKRYDASAVRPAAHAGGVYPAQQSELRPFLTRFFESAGGPKTSSKKAGMVRGIVAPHIDFRRGNVAYAWAYEALLRSPTPPEVFLVLGTSHKPLRKRFAISKKGYDTPFGPVHSDTALVDAISKRLKSSFFEEETAHRQEHSIEFQAVMLGYALGQRAKMIPVLCGSVHDLIGKDPSKDHALSDFIGATLEAIQEDGRRVCVVAGVDLAHIGPHFGDPKAPNHQDLTNLEARDRETMAKVCQADAAGFFEDVAHKRNDRRICGFAPLYSFLRLLEGQRGELTYYGQAETPPTGSIVSFASAVFES